jgi:hypothetical protein
MLNEINLDFKIFHRLLFTFDVDGVRLAVSSRSVAAISGEGDDLSIRRGTDESSSSSRKRRK